MTVTEVPVEPMPAASPPWQPKGHPVRLAATLLVVAIGLCAIAVHTGVVGPDLEGNASAWNTGTGEGRMVSLTLEVRSERSAPVRVQRVGESLPGLELASVRVPAPFLPDSKPFEPASIPDEGARMELLLTYRVTDCAAVPKGRIGIPIVVRTAIGLTRTVRLPVTLAQVPDTPGSYTYEGPTNPYDEPWQVTLARSACRR